MASLTAQDRLAFQDQVRRLLADFSSGADVRRVMETPERFDRELWRRLADMGVVGLIVEEAYGGVAAGPEALELIMEEAGAALLCSPLLSSGVLAAALIQALGDEASKARLLPSIADGSTIATVAVTGGSGGWRLADIDVLAIPGAGAGDDWRLEGEASFVTDGQIADLFLVVAHAPDAVGIFEVAPRADGLVVKSLPTFDHTLRLAELSFGSVAARRLPAAGPAWDAVAAALDLARVALSGEQAGGARRVLDFTVDYARARMQFGRPIGSFQAIKHMAADLLLETQSAVSAARAAAHSLAIGAPDTAAAVNLAAFACADAFTQVTATAIQMHGGIAFTWDHPAHLYLRRARADAQLFGAPAVHRELYLQALGA